MASVPEIGTNILFTARADVVWVNRSLGLLNESRTQLSVMAWEERGSYVHPEEQ